MLTKESEELGALLPRVQHAPAEATTRAWVDRLDQSECPALTARRARRATQTGAPQDPLVWQRARGANVQDVCGNVYVDLTAGFGAAALGHGHPRLRAALSAQSNTLIHGLGDLHPSTPKIALMEALKAIAPWPDARVMLGLSGSDALEAALKTAMLHTGRAGVIAFAGGYHGLSHGPLAISGYKAGFRRPFTAQLNPHVSWVEPPRDGRNPVIAVGACLQAVDAAWKANDAGIGAVVIEAIQGRGGVVPMPAALLEGLHTRCRDRGALLVLDEVLVGLGRCGEWWLGPAEGTAGDILCAGKALGGGMPISACLAPGHVMAAWGDPEGEALHTGTFFGHPLSCAAALAVLDTLRCEHLLERCRVLGTWLNAALAEVVQVHAQVQSRRGRGLLWGIELNTDGAALALCHRLRTRGYLALPAGPAARVLQITPPLTITQSQLEGFVAALHVELAR